MNKLGEVLEDEVLRELEERGAELTPVVRERVAELAFTAADVATRSMTGNVTQLELDALRARAANLQAAVSIAIGGMVAQATQRAFLGLVKVAFAAIG